MMTYPRYQDRKPKCWYEDAELSRKDKGTYECPKCNAEYVVPVEVLMSESRAPRRI